MSENSILNERINQIDTRVSKLESDSKELSKLSTLMEIQIDMNKEQDTFLREQSHTLVKMNENLTSLNEVTVRLDGRIGTLESKIDEHDEKVKIDIVELIKKVFMTVLTTLGVGAIIWVLTQYLNVEVPK